MTTQNKVAFRVHTVWRVDESRVPLFMERFSTVTNQREIEKDPDTIVKVAYGNFVREPLRTFARDEVQRRNGLEVKDALITIEAQKAMVGSPNHTVVYIPVGQMGVPLTGTIASTNPAAR